MKKNYDLSVLIVDDDFVTRLVHRKIIESLTQFKTSCEAINGLEALDHLINVYSQGKTIPDLILLDTNMPEMDGFDFIRKLKALAFAKDIMIIIVSVSDNACDKQQAKDLGIEYYFTKPLTSALLKSTILGFMESNLSG